MASSSPINAKKRARENSINVEVASANKRPRNVRSDLESKGRAKRKTGEKGANQPSKPKDVSRGKEKVHVAKSVPSAGLSSASAATGAKGTTEDAVSKAEKAARVKPSRRIRKLAPPRPFPSVPTSVSATGPKSLHKEGKNRICITRKTALGGYLKRCKELLTNDGYKELHLYALGAAIPHLARLAVSLPSILPFAPDGIHSEVKTGTVELHDELIPENEEEDITMRTRGKSTMSVIIRIGDRKPELQAGSSRSQRAKTKKAGKAMVIAEDGISKAEQIVIQEGDQESD